MGGGITDVARATVEEERIRESLSGHIENSDEVYKWLIENEVIKVTPPEIPRASMSFISGTVSDEDIASKTIKLGNVKFNLKKAFLAIMHGTLQLVAVDFGLGINKNTFAALILVIWDIYGKTKDVMTLELRKKQAYVVLALWELQQEELMITVDMSFIYFKSRYGTKISMSEDYYASVLDLLEEMECISIEDGTIILKEEISYEYK